MASVGLFNRALVEKYDQPGPRYTSYPTAPHFHEGFTQANYIDAVNLSHAKDACAPLSLYIHVPFCESLCYYCACNKIITQKRARADEYLRYLKQEIALQGALFNPKRPLRQLHFGGGTPTYFDDDQLADLLSVLAQHFNMQDDPRNEYSIEVDPRTVTPERITALRAMGFNRISLGIQDFNPAVQEAVNRLQSYESTQTMLEAARLAQFKSISFDLIYGLPKQTNASFEQTLDQVIALKPDRIAAYSYAHLPTRVRAQRLIRPEDMPPPERKLELLELTINKLTQAGYVYIGMDHFALPTDELAIAQEDGSLQRNFQGYSTQAECDLVALGVSAIGFIAGSYSQNVKTLKEYYRALDAQQLPIERGYTRTIEDQLRARVIHDLMCQGSVDLQRLTEEFGEHLVNELAFALSQLGPFIDDGLVTFDGRVVHLQPQGQLMMRNVAMLFDGWLNRTPEHIRYSRTV